MSPEYNFAGKISAVDAQEAAQIVEVLTQIRGVSQANLLLEPPKTTRLLKNKAAAAYLHVDVRTLRRYVEAGQITPIKLAGIGRPRFRLDDLDKLLGFPASE